MQVTCPRTAYKKAPHPGYMRFVQFIAKTGKFTIVYAARPSHRIRANCFQPHINLSEKKKYFICIFTCGGHAKLPPTCIQNCLVLQAKAHAVGKQKRPQSQAK